MNIGSRTRGTFTIPGVKDIALSTRPINDILNKIEIKEQELLESKIIPRIAVCGAGAAGVELSFGFKSRWSKLFGQEIDVTLISQDETVLKNDCDAVKK